jgi:hypothetical protein
MGATTMDAVSAWTWDQTSGLNEIPFNHSLLQYRLNQNSNNLRWALGWEYRPSNPKKESFGGYLEGSKPKIRWIIGQSSLLSNVEAAVFCATLATSTGQRTHATLDSMVFGQPS